MIIQSVKNFIYKLLSRLHNFSTRQLNDNANDKRVEQIESKGREKNFCAMSQNIHN